MRVSGNTAEARAGGEGSEVSRPAGKGDGQSPSSEAGKGNAKRREEGGEEDRPG